jgi:hypothetical protein
LHIIYIEHIKIGSDICTCRPYLIYGIEECVKQAQQGGVGVIVYCKVLIIISRDNHINSILKSVKKEEHWARLQSIWYTMPVSEYYTSTCEMLLIIPYFLYYR